MRNKKKQVSVKKLLVALPFRHSQGFKEFIQKQAKKENTDPAHVLRNVCNAGAEKLYKVRIHDNEPLPVRK